MKQFLAKFFDKTFWKFILVGIANTLFGTAIMFVFYNVFHLSYWVSSASNYIFGSILSYFLNKHFTFQSKDNSPQEHPALCGQHHRLLPGSLRCSPAADPVPVLRSGNHPAGQYCNAGRNVHFRGVELLRPAVLCIPEKRIVIADNKAPSECSELWWGL